MKKFAFFLLSACVLCLVSCGSEEAEYTPYILVSDYYVNPTFRGDTIVVAQDTLGTHVVDDHFVLDTIHLSDTVVLAAGFGSYANSLVAARINFDTTALNMTAKLSDAAAKVLLPSSNLRTLQLYINPGYAYVAIPLGFRPLKTGTHRIEFVVESDSEFSPNSVVYYQPVAE